MLANSEEKREKTGNHKRSGIPRENVIRKIGRISSQKNWGFPGNQFWSENVSPLPTVTSEYKLRVNSRVYFYLFVPRSFFLFLFILFFNMNHTYSMKNNTYFHFSSSHLIISLPLFYNQFYFLIYIYTIINL